MVCLVEKIHLDRLYDGVKLSPRRGLTDFMAQEVIVPEGERAGTLFRPKTWQKLVLDEIERGGYRDVWLCAGPRSGKSLLAIGGLLWRVAEYGESVMLLGPEQKIVYDFFQDKVEKCITSNPRISRYLPEYQSQKTVSHVYRFSNGAALRLLYNAASIRSFDASALFSTESSQISGTKDEANVLVLAQKRMSDHAQPFQLHESTPTRPDVPFSQAIKSGTDSYIAVPCPHCGAYFDAGAREVIRGWDVENESDLDPHLECPNCGGRIDESHRQQMIDSATITHRNPNAKEFSVTVGWFVASRATIADVARLEWQYRQSKSVSVLRDLYQNYLALPLSLEEEQVKTVSSKYGKETILSNRASYKKGEVTPNIIYTACGFDCQKEYGYFVVSGWDSIGNTYLLDWGNFQVLPYHLQKQNYTPTPAMVLAALEEAYSVVSLYNPRSIFVDTSYKHIAADTHLIRDWCRKYNNVHAIAGRANTQFSRFRKTSNLPMTVNDIACYSQQQDGSFLWFIDVDAAKSRIRNAQMMPAGSPGGVYYPRDIEMNSSIVNHFLAENPEVITKNGIDLLRWVHDKKKGAHNDMWDGFVYSWVAGQIYAACNPQIIQAPAPSTPAPKPPAPSRRPTRVVSRRPSGWMSGL